MSVLSSARVEPEVTDFLFEDLISPLDPEKFFDEHWEQQKLYIERDAPNHFASLFTLDDVDRAIHVARSCPEKALALVPPQGSGQKRRQVPAAEVSREQVYRDFREGFTIRLGGVDRFWGPLALFKAALSERLSTDISVNLYLTPASSHGFVAHYDNHDVFILQLHGSKRWHLGEPTMELPGIGLEHVGDRVPLQTLPNDSPRLSESVVLGAGDLLYLPRGFYHKPVCETETSLHLTVGVKAIPWSALLARALEFVTLDHLPLRKALPPGFAVDPEAREGMAEAFAEMVRVFAEKADFEEAIENVIRERRLAELYPGDGHFASLDRLDAVEMEALLERRRGLTCTVAEREETATLYFGPNFVKAPRAMAPIFEFICETRRFRAQDLPGPLSDRTKLILVRRLILEGCLRVADPASLDRPGAGEALRP